MSPDRLAVSLPDTAGAAPAQVGGPDGRARFQLTLHVDDVDGTCEELTRRGVDLLNGPIGRPWGVRTPCFRDRAGHVSKIAQPVPR